MFNYILSHTVHVLKGFWILRSLPIYFSGGLFIEVRTLLFVILMLDPIELVFYVIEITLILAIFVLEFIQFRKEDKYMNDHKISGALKPFIAQAEIESHEIDNDIDSEI